MAGLKFDITGDNGNMLSALHGVQKGVRQTQQVVEQSGQGIEQMFAGIKSAAVSALGAFSAQQFASKVMQVRGQFQQLEVAFETMLGNADDARRLMDQLVKTAAKTPFDLQGIAQGAKQLLAYGIQADDVNETLVHLGDIAAGLSMPLNDLVYLYGTTMVQGRMFTQDLRQFQGRGIPMAEELAKQFGVAKEKVGELVTAGKVGADDMKKAIISMTTEGGKFAGLMEKQSHTITGQISDIEDAIDNMFNAIGKKSEGGINTGLSLVSKLVENWETVARVLGTVATAYGISKAAIIAYNVYQTIHNRLLQEAALQSKLAAMNNITLSNSEAMAAARTTLFSASIKGLTAAIAANPVGALTVGLTTLLSVIQLVNTDTDKMAVYTDKFGKDAATTLTTLDTYANTLLGLSEGHDKLKLSGSTSKKVLEELNAILSDYGITQIKEGDNIDSVNAKREQAIQLIKEESIERQRLNDIDAVSQEYQQAIQDAQNQLMNDLSNAVYNKTGDTLLNKIFGSADEIRENASAISMIIGDVVRNNMDLIVNKSGEEYDKGMDQIRSKIQERMKKIGLSDEAIKSQWADNSLLKADDIIQKYVNSVQNATEAQDRHLDMVNKSAEAERNAASASMDYGDKVAALERKLQGPTDGVHQLYKNIRELMSQYKDNTIGFHINFDGKFPSWMGKMGIPELERLSKRFAAIGANLKDGGSVFVNGRRYTKQQALQRSADYAEAAENKQTKQDEKEKEAKRKAEEEAKNNESKKKNYASEAKRRKEEERREKERIAEEIRGRNKAIKDYEKGVLEQQKETELNLRQQNIDLKEESYEKEVEQINLNYDRLIAENDKRRKDMIEALKDNKVNEWLNKNPKATKVQQENYRNSLNLTDKNLSATQKTQLEEYERIAKEIKAKGIDDISRSHFATLNSYLKEYGTFEEKKLAITKEYEDKISKAGSIGEKANLEMKRDKDIESLRNEELKDSIDWNGIFSDLQGHTKQYLQGLRNQLQELLNTGNLPIDQMQTVSEKINAIDDELGKQQGIWDFVGERTREHNRLLKEAADAQERLNVAKKEEENANSYLTSIKSNVQKSLSNAGLDLKIEDITTSSLNGKIDLTNEKFKGASANLQKLAVAEGKLTEARKKTIDATNKARQAKDAAKRKFAQEIADWFSGAQDFIKSKGIDQLPDLLSSVGLGGIGDKVGKGLDGFNSAAGAAADFASGNYIGAALKGISAITSFGSVLGIGGGNEKEVAETTERLTKSNEILKASIDDLKNSIEKSNGSKAVDSYRRAVDNQKQVIENTMDILKSQMYYHSAHHSNVYYWDLNKSDYADINSTLAKFAKDNPTAETKRNSVNSINDIFQLTPEQMKVISTEQVKIWQKMLEAGKYDKSEYWKNYIELAGQLEELTEKINNNLTQTSFDSLHDDFVSTIMDMDATASDFANNFTKMMAKAWTNAAVGNMMDDKLKKFYAKWSKKMQSRDADNNEANFSKYEIDEMRAEYQKLVDQALSLRNTMSQITGYGSQLSKQNATANGSSSITYEQSTNLIALITAGNISRDQIKDIFSTIMASAGTLTAFSSSTNSAVLEIKNLMIYSNSHLEDILKYTKSIYSEFSDKIDSVNKNLMEIR